MACRLYSTDFWKQFPVRVMHSQFPSILDFGCHLQYQNKPSHLFVFSGDARITCFLYVYPFNSLQPRSEFKFSDIFSPWVLG